MLKKKDVLILSSLRSNARERLTKISRRTRIPVSSIFDKIKTYERKQIIRKHAAILNFAELGFHTRANIAVKVARESRDQLMQYLMKHEQVNSLFRIGNGYDFLIEGIFKHIKELEDFMEIMEEKFKIKEKEIYYLIDDIKREGFMERNEVNETLSQTEGGEMND